jgi:hypothetical protein
MPNPASPAFLDRLRASLPEGRVRPPEPRYLEEPRGRWAGQAAAVVTPATTEEVAIVVRAAPMLAWASSPTAEERGSWAGRSRPTGLSR